jgi:hypothetical protein
MTKTEATERLKTVRAQIKKVRDQAAVARKGIQIATQDNDATKLALAQTALDKAEQELELAKGAEAAILSQLSGGVLGSFGAALSHNIEAQSTLRELAGSQAPVRGNVSLGPVLSMEETLQLTGRSLAAVVDPGDPVGARGSFGGIVPTPIRPLSILDLLRSVPFDGRTKDYMQRQGGVADAGIQTPGAVKTEADLTYEPMEAEAATVASWTKVNRQDVDDIEGLLDDIRLALRTGVLFKLEDLVLNGAPGLPGILTASGLVAPTVTATNLADAVGEVKALLALSGVVVNFVAANPVDINVEESRTTDGSGEYVNTIDSEGRVRRVPLVPAAALPVGTFLIGDSTHAQVGVRSPVSAVVANQDQDDLLRNRLTVLVEGRWAPIVKVPAAFATFELAEA